MSLLILLRRMVLGCSLVVALPAVALAQASYSTNGGEFPVAGSLPGDQVRPQLSLSPSGGFLVWQDNNTCPFGVGISALALDSNFSPVGARFRVNKVGAGDQENPRVSLLNDGGAAFVWQTRNWRGFYNVYARFLSPNSTWLAADFRVNTNAGNFAKLPNPSIATLASGDALIVWASLNQVGGNSMQDIFGQRFSPTGQKLGPEFLVNQFTFLNQRSPALAALSDGRFVVAWVSEQQRVAMPDGVLATTLSVTPDGSSAIRPSVDIYARIYEASGVPAGNEILVNTGSDVCANPAIAPAPDGGFIIAWSQKDLQVRNNGWDVFARPFSSSGTGGAVQRVNSRVFGDQFNPQLRAVGNNCLTVWTSLAQDGSREGVFGQFLQTDGASVGGEFRVNTTTLGSQKDPALASDNYGRFLSVWTSYSPSSRSFDLAGQTYVSSSFVPLSPTNHYAAPPPESFSDPAPTGNSGAFVQDPLPGSSSAGPGLDFPGTIASPGLPNPLAALPGAYNGLFFDPNGVSAASAGFFTAKLTSRSPRYAYSARLMLGGRTYSLSGKFDETGSATGSIRRGSGLPDLTVQLQLVHLDSGADQLRGSVSDRLGTWQADLMADRLVFGKANKTTYAGDYTIVIPAAANGPEGSGFGSFKVNPSGVLKWTTTLADGSKINQGSAVSAQGYWPLYAPLYRGKGLITGWVRLTTGDSGGRLIWIKPRGASAPYFQGSFTNSLDAVLSPHSKAAALNLFQSGSLSFTGGTLNTPLTKALTFDARGRQVSPSARELKLSLTSSSGLFRGTALLLSQPPAKISFQGVLLENGNFGAGFFQNRGLSGQVYWSPGS